MAITDLIRIHWSLRRRRHTVLSVSFLSWKPDTCRSLTTVIVQIALSNPCGLPWKCIRCWNMKPQANIKVWCLFVLEESFQWLVNMVSSLWITHPHSEYQWLIFVHNFEPHKADRVRYSLRMRKHLISHMVKVCIFYLAVCTENECLCSRGTTVQKTSLLWSRIINQTV